MAEVNEKELEEVVGGAKQTQYDPNKCYGEVIGQGPYKGYTCRIYQVEKGDTLSAIAYNYTFNHDFNMLARFNGIENPSLIFVTQKIYCPIGQYIA